MWFNLKCCEDMEEIDGRKGIGSERKIPLWAFSLKRNNRIDKEAPIQGVL